MYLVFTRMPGESYRRRLGFCCCVCVVSLERCLTALCVESVWGSCFMTPFDCQ